MNHPIGEPILVLNKVSKAFRNDWTFKKKPVLFDVDFSVVSGECFGFVGPNGAGKTTTIKILLDLIRPTSGEVTVLGGKPGDASVRRHVGFLPERPYFYEHLTAGETMRFYAELCDVPRARVASRADEMLDLVGLGDAKKKPLRAFSKGMLQRLGLGQALVGDPKLVILDEPMSGLDPIGRRAVRDVIVALREQKKTIFFSSHILPDVEQICDRVAMIFKGRLRLVGSMSDILARSTRKEVEVVLRPSDRALPPAFAHLAPVNDGQVRGLVAADVLQAALAAAVTEGIEVVAVTPQRGRLEDEFIKGIAEHS
jgi:ABC-2 type transport system ATP-binding protein